ncbi:MAG: hypothetical protein PHP73_01005 [Candidatus Omnitrophica bacterium]|nr:hypothetical protein [Candidatus Omnitrophota bacterium]
MRVILFLTEQQYNLVRSHLFKGKKEQGCFLFVNSIMDAQLIELKVKDVHKVEAGGWSYQSGCHLELEEKEKVKVMLKAREYGCDLIECHSHRFGGLATFSPSDIHGLSEFVRYIWWKLPGKIYGAVVFTKSDVRGQIWLPKQENSVFISEIKVIDNKGNFKRLCGVPIKKSFFNIIKRRNND